MMPEEMIKRKIKSLERWLPKSHRTAICAVSGGLDSMCLLYLLYTWCREREIPFIAAHFNHQLRETADRDEKFVRDWCAEREIKFISGHGNVRAFAGQEKLSPEEAARILRYQFLRRVAKENRPVSWIYTAHHLDDNVETVLLNLIRGTGIKG